MKSSGLLRGLAVLIACAATACGDARSAERDDSNAPGNGRVVSTAPKWRSGEGWALSAKPVLVVGGSESDSAAVLYGVAGAVRLADGRIVVADRGANGRWSAVSRACRRLGAVLLGQVDVAPVRPVPLLLDGGCLLAVLIVLGVPLRDFPQTNLEQSGAGPASRSRSVCSASRSARSAAARDRTPRTQRVAAKG